jgi:hypothetical protein
MTTAKKADAAEAAKAGQLPRDPWAGAEEMHAGGGWPTAETDPYRSTESGICRTKGEGDGKEPLTNFPARIVASLIEDDGLEQHRFLEMEALHRGRLHRFKLCATEFAAMAWPMEQLGPDAIVYAGQAKRDRAREAIQLLSGTPKERRSFAHTGWREIGGAHFYLHAGGAIGTTTLCTAMALPEALRHFALPEPPDGARLQDTVRASLRMVNVAPAHVTVPMYGLIPRAIVGAADFSGWIKGATSAGKSVLAALLQQHFGPAMHYRNLPAAWQSTANANQELAFAAKDALLVVDDFVPIGSGPELARQRREADHLLRSQGNRAGRLRMRSDATLRLPRPPRGLLLSTGEDTPPGESLRGRLVIVELVKADLDWKKKLSECQRDADAGVYAQATAGFIRWLAPQLDEARRQLAARVRELRDQAVAGTDHKRTPEITAQLGAALELWLAFAHEAGAINEGQRRELWAKWWEALCKVNREQAAQQAESNPAKRFVELLGSAISAGKAHLAAANGNAPDNPQAWGWRTEDMNPHAKGDRVGWVIGEDLYLDFDAALRVVQEHGRAAGEAPNLMPGTLRKRLKDAGLLKTTDEKRGTLHIRKTLDSARRDVLHLGVGAVVDLEMGRWERNGQVVGASGPAQQEPIQDGDSGAKSGAWAGGAGWAGEIGGDPPGSRGRP